MPVICAAHMDGTKCLILLHFKCLSMLCCVLCCVYFERLCTNHDTYALKRYKKNIKSLIIEMFILLL